MSSPREGPGLSAPFLSRTQTLSVDTVVSGYRSTATGLSSLKESVAGESEKRLSASRFPRGRRQELTPAQSKRYEQAFVEVCKEGATFLDLPRLQAAFQLLGYRDVPAEDIEFMAQKACASRRPHVRLDDFSEIMATFEEKREFFARVRPSPNEDVNARLRTAASHFRRVFYEHGARVPFGEDVREVQLVMRGSFSVFASVGGVDLHVCDLGPGALLGKGHLPHNAAKLVCGSPAGVVLAAPRGEVLRRLGQGFLDTLQTGAPQKEVWYRARVRQYASLARRNRAAGLHLPFMMPRPRARAELPSVEDGSGVAAAAPRLPARPPQWKMELGRVVETEELRHPAAGAAALLAGPAAWGSGAEARPAREELVRRRSTSSHDGRMGGGGGARSASRARPRTSAPLARRGVRPSPRTLLLARVQRGGRAQPHKAARSRVMGLKRCAPAAAF